MRRRQQSSGAPGVRAIRRRGRRRVLARRRDRALIYRAPARAAVLLAGIVAVVITVALVTGFVLAGAVIVGAIVLAWLALMVRVTRLEPAGPRGDGPTPPGGAGVREPRRPMPFAPAGAAAMPLPDEEPPGRAVAQA